jgi:hypothetical protein
MGDVSFSGRRHLSSSLKFRPELGVHVILVKVIETVLLATATASEHDQEVMELIKEHKNLNKIKMATYLNTTVRVSRPRSICTNLLPVEELTRVTLIEVKLTLVEGLKVTAFGAGD